MPVTHEEEQAFIKRLEELDALDDPETAHIEADEILIEVARKYGHGRINAAFIKLKKWYS